jgi:hypothetical protein
MHSENYKLYRKHKTELFEMVYEVCRNAPSLPIFATEEEKAEHKKKMDKYLESIKPEILERLKALGFGEET